MSSTLLTSSVQFCRGNMTSIELFFDSSFENKKFSVKTDDCLSFIELDAWTRKRVNCGDDVSLQYLDESGNEVIPCGGFLKKHSKLWVRKASTETLSSSSLSSQRSQSSTLQGGAVSSTLWPYFVWYGPWVLLLILAITIAPDAESQQSYSDVLDLVLELTNTKEWKNLILEAYVGFLSWSTSYLFVRRCLNPENSRPLEKFGPDAWFGGMAAAVGIMMKRIILKLLDVRKI
jgi:hypothetical protein